jgi:hypothetical protein
VTGELGIGFLLVGWLGKRDGREASTGTAGGNRLRCRNMKQARANTRRGETRG